MHIGTRQTGVAHLGVPKKISENYRTQKLAKIQEKARLNHEKELSKNSITRKFSTPESAVEAQQKLQSEGYDTDIYYDNKTAYYMVKAKKSNISKSEHKAEVAMVQDEAEGEAKYLQMAETADKEGRHSEAQVFRQHAQDEARHRAEDSAIVKKSYRMQRLDEIKYELAETSNKEKLVELRREAHDIWFNEHNYGTSKENDKEARKVYDSINAKLDSKLENEHKSGLEWEKNFFKSR
jgi:rubrerythrin